MKPELKSLRFLPILLVQYSSVMWVKTGATGNWGIVPTLKLFLCLFSTGSRWVSTHHLLRLVLAQISVTDECRRAEDNGGQHFPPLSAAERWAQIKRTAQRFSLNAFDNLSILTVLIKSACCKTFRRTRLITECRDAPLAKYPEKKHSAFRN